MITIYLSVTSLSSVYSLPTALWEHCNRLTIMAGGKMLLAVVAVLLLSSGAVQHVHAAKSAKTALRQFALDLSVPPKRTP